MKIKPLQDRVIVKRMEEEQKTAGGIIIPDSAKEKPQQGKVLEGGTRVDMTVKVGDLVLFGKYSGSEVKIDGDEVLIMREDDILGIITK